MRMCLWVGCLLLMAVYSANAAVDISEIGIGARPLGMGKACIGGVDDASSIFTNPAGLALNPNLNVISMSGSLLTDVNYVMLGAADSSPLGRFGIGYINASVGSIPITVITGSGSTQAVEQVDTADYGSSIIFFTYGSRLSRFLRGKADNVSVGGSLKYFTQGFSGGGTSMQGAVGTGMDMDLGLLWEINPWANLGLTLSNCLPASFGGRFVWKKNDVAESIPLATRLGCGLKIMGDTGAYFRSEGQALSLLMDYESGRGKNRPSVWHTGLEYWPMELLALRLGVDQKPRATETGTGVDNNLTAGVGIKYMGFTFDYAYNQVGELAENATCFFSIGYRGPEERIKCYIEEKDERKCPVPLPVIAPKPELVSFTDLAKDHWAGKPIEYLATLRIMGGYPDRTFRPEKALTRGELAALLVKAKGFKIKSTGKSSFKDINPKQWVSPYVEKAVERKYMEGYPDSSFRPNQKITRAEAAVVFSKFSGLYVKEKVTQQVYPDVKKAHWASPAIAASKQEGFFEYLGEKDFEPDADLSRAEAAEILSKTPFIREKIKKLISGEK
jgi:hypothetical protein